MKKLFLIRHAKSSWSDPTLSDFSRGLNKRGKRDAPFMAEKLAKSGAKPDRIISSPAKRAKKTAQIMAQGVGFSKSSIVYDDSVYSSSVEDLIDILKKVDEKYSEVILVGHNFAITDLAVTLTFQTIDNIPTSGIVAMESKIEKWNDLAPGACAILFFDYPKRYKALR